MLPVFFEPVSVTFNFDSKFLILVLNFTVKLIFMLRLKKVIKGTLEYFDTLSIIFKQLDELGR